MIPKNSLSSRMRVRIGIKMRMEMKDEKKKKHTLNMYNILSSIFPFLSWLSNYRNEKKKKWWQRKGII